jgi:putative sterol carrier protein
MSVENVREIFEKRVPKRLQTKPDLVEKMNTSYKFVVTGDQACTWLVDLTKPGGEVVESDAPAKCTLTIGSKDLLDLMNGNLSPQMAFLSGKVKVAGDISLAMKLGSLLG